MSKLMLVIALAAAAPALAHEGDAQDERASCSVDVGAFDDEGRLRPVRRVSAIETAVVLRGKVSRQDRGDEAPEARLVFDVFSPRGDRYRVLVAEPFAAERGKRRVERAARVRQATLAVAGTSIVWTSIYGKWRVEPRFEGQERPCGRAQYFTIRP